jgi:hypothetical protein
MVEVFDARSVSFLAVTQQLNLRAPRDSRTALSHATTIVTSSARFSIPPLLKSI